MVQPTRGVEPRCNAAVGTLTTAIALLAAIAVSACTSDARESGAAVSEVERATEQSEPSTDTSALPEREGARRETTGSVPHVQVGAAPVPAVDAELRRRVFQLPGVEDLASDRSLPGARGLAFSRDVNLARPDVIRGSREFAHIHPDGSLHVWLPVERAIEVDDTKWGELHPWVDRDDFWDGVAMIYTPETPDELDITIRLVVDAYNFVVGTTLQPDDIA